MTVGFRAADGRDLDEILEATGTGGWDVGMYSQLVWQDLGRRYVYDPAGSPGVDLGYKTSDGNDFGRYFRAKSVAAPALTATQTPGPYVVKSYSNTGVKNSENLTVTPAGGNGSYTYAWSVLSNDAGGSIVGSGATVSFNTGNLLFGVYQTILRCTITSGAQTITKDFTIAWELSAA